MIITPAATVMIRKRKFFKLNDLRGTVNGQLSTVNTK